MVALEKTRSQEPSATVAVNLIGPLASNDKGISRRRRRSFGLGVVQNAGDPPPSRCSRPPVPVDDAT